MIPLFLMIALAAVSGETFVAKEACSGDSVVLLTEKSLNTDWVTVVIHKDNMIKASWMKTNSTINEIHSEKRLIYRGGDIWILNIVPSDEGIYTFVQQSGNISNVFYRVQLFILILPSMNCKPEISRVEMVLYASLVGAECGKPQASVYFVEYPHTTYENKHKVQLSPGKEIGTYTVCIATPALNCARNFKPSEFCSYYTIHESTYEITKYDHSIPVKVALLCILLTFVILVLALQLKPFYLKLRKRYFTQNNPRKEDTEQWTGDALSSFESSDNQPQRTRHNHFEREPQSTIPLTNGISHIHHEQTQLV